MSCESFTKYQLANLDLHHGLLDQEWADPEFATFARTPNGVLGINQNFSEIDPSPNPGGTSAGPWVYYPMSAQAADPTNHLAVVLGSESYGYSDRSNPEYYGPYQLASYTINNKTGGIASTNTWKNMPIPSIANISGLSMSPSGKLLALAGHPGLQIFHFNGAAPITAYSSMWLPSVNLDQLGWDKNNHFFALSYAEISSTLWWSSFYASGVTITGSDGSSYSIPDSGGSGGNQIVSPVATTTYTITATGVDGTKVSGAATVTVNSLASSGKVEPACAAYANSAGNLCAYPSALNTVSQLYVYTLTPTSIAPVAGSPYAVPTAYGVTGLIVVPK